MDDLAEPRDVYQPEFEPMRFSDEEEDEPADRIDFSMTHDTEVLRAALGQRCTADHVVFGNHSVDLALAAAAFVRTARGRARVHLLYGGLFSIALLDALGPINTATRSIYMLNADHIDYANAIAQAMRSCTPAPSTIFRIEWCRDDAIRTALLRGVIDCRCVNVAVSIEWRVEVYDWSQEVKAAAREVAFVNETLGSLEGPPGPQGLNPRNYVNRPDFAEMRRVADERAARHWAALERRHQREIARTVATILEGVGHLEPYSQHGAVRRTAR